MLPYKQSLGEGVKKSDFEIKDPKGVKFGKGRNSVSNMNPHFE